jgi:thiamine-monophosphate kinase
LPLRSPERLKVVSSDPSSGTLADLGESGLVTKILARIEESKVKSPRLEIAAGDDAAVIGTSGSSLVLSVDMYAEGKHFRTDWSTAIEIGRRCAAGSIADVCAMGATPIGVLLAIGLPAVTASHWVGEFMAGFIQEAESAGSIVLGGDVSGCDSIVISVTALGTVASGTAITRSGARAGDIVAICGRSGMAAAGLRVLQRGLRSPRVLVDAFRVPELDYSAGSRAAKSGATSMIDISDGLVADLEHIARDSGVGIGLDTKKIVVPAELVSTAAAFGADPMGWILAGGDDHAFAATFPPKKGLPAGFVAIGTVLEDSIGEVLIDGVLYRDAYEVSPGFQHFSS